MKRVLIGLIMTLALAGCGFQTVEVGHRGILTHFGQVEGEARTEGLYFYNPFSESMHQIDVRTQSWSAKTEAYTKDVQESTIFFTLNYNLRPEAAATVFRTVGEDWSDKLVAQYVHQRVKEVIAQWDAVDLVSHRPEANQAALRAITDSLAQKNVVVTSFALTDIQFSDNFDKAVEAKVIAQQNAVQEQNRTEQVKQQAQQVVIRATSEAQSMKIRADALSQNAKLVSWEAVQKWDGHLPNYMLNNSTLPFLNVSGDKSQ
jgi:regulator of protease activity HflC (stomatin/prohibitin superfamily)